MEQKMLRVMIVDDEWYTLDDIRLLSEETGFIDVCGTYENPITALNEFEIISPDVVFVDIEMPQMDGIELAERFLEKKPSVKIVFITAFNQYAVQAFDINALDYIMKPIDSERFAKMAIKLKNVPIFQCKLEQKLGIQLFGDFEVKINNVPVKWERAKAEELFAYLLINLNRKIDKYAIIDQLWSEYELSKALPILQTSACRIRSIFSSLENNVILEYTGSGYRLVISECDCELDLFENLLDTFKLEDENSYFNVEKACNLLIKGFLSKKDFIWRFEKEQELKERLCKILHNAIEFYQKNQDDLSTLKYLKLLIMVVPEDEEANIIMIKLLIKNGERDKAVKHYKWLEKILDEEFGVAPSDAVLKSL